MKKTTRGLLAFCTILLSTQVHAQSNPTTRVPMCLQFPDRKVMVPCTGVVPVDPVTGNPIPWGETNKTTREEPLYTQETSRRIHWSETSTPLGANQQFTGTTHDDGAVFNGGSTKSTSFSCFTVTDQAGTLIIQGSDDGITWLTFQSRPVVADTGLYLVQPLFTRYWRCRYLNGNIPQTVFSVKSAFGM